MARTFNDNIDLANNELQNFVIQNLTPDPGTGLEDGRLYYSTSLNALRLRAGGAWTTLAQGAGFSGEDATDAVAAALALGTHTGGLGVTYDDTGNAISLTLTNNELFKDVVGPYFNSGTGSSGITVTWDDAGDDVNYVVTDSPLLGGSSLATVLARASHTGSQLASTISDFTEAAQDVVSTVVGAGGIVVSYDDAGTGLTTLTLTANEAFYDVVAPFFASGTGSSGITVTYDDAGNDLNYVVTDSPLLGGQNSAYHLARANHTGTQLAATLSDLATAVLARSVHTGTQASTTISDFAEAVSDQIGTMITGNTETGITVTYDDADNTLDFVVSITSAAVTDFTEAAQDAAGALLTTGTRTGITAAYDDANNEIDLAVTDSPLLGGQNSAYHLARANHSGTQLAATISDFSTTTRGLVSASDTGTLDLTYTAGTGVFSGAVLDSPTITGLTPANLRDRTTHTGSQTASTISDFDTQVRTNRLDQMTAPSTSVSMNSQKIINLLAGTADTDAINLAQATAMINGLDNKASVRVASLSANINIASAPASIDGVTLAATNRVLLKSQTLPETNGIYIFNGAGSAMTRATDADISAEMTSGLYVFVDQGSVNANKGFQLFTDDPIVVGTDALDFQAVSGAGQITAGAGLTKTGDIIDAVAGTGIAITADAIAVDRTTGAGRVSLMYAVTLTGGATSEVVTHSLGTRDVAVMVYLVGGTFAEEEFSIEHTSTSTITIRSAITIPAATYRCVVFG